MLLLIPMYSVFSQGLQNYDIQPMLDVFGFQIIDLHCAAAPASSSRQQHGPEPVPQPDRLRRQLGRARGHPRARPGALFSGLSILAIISALLQLVASRMTLPPQAPAGADDPNARTQRQMALFLPFISLIYGSILPAGLFIYWIVSTLFRSSSST